MPRISIILGKSSNEKSIFEKSLEYQHFTDYELIITGISYAEKNIGLKRATGEYVFFPEPWMEISENALKVMTQGMQPKLRIADASNSVTSSSDVTIDLVAAGYEILAEDESGALEKVYETPERNSRVIEKEDFLSRILYPAHDQGMIWNKLFRRSIIAAHDISFDEDIYYEAERLFLVKYLTHAFETRQISDKLLFYNTSEVVDWPSDELFRDELSEEELVKAAWELHKRTVTEVEVYIRMRKLLRKVPDAKWLAEQTAVYTMLMIFVQMLDAGEGDFYKKSPLRKYAKKAKRLDYSASTAEDEALLNMLLEFGRTGRI